MSVQAEALAGADDIIDEMTNRGYDYSKYREQIAEQLFEHGIWSGSWIAITDLEDDALPDLKLIQEDEYDQSLSEDDEDRPAEPYDFYCGHGYVWIL